VDWRVGLTIQARLATKCAGRLDPAWMGAGAV